MDVCVSPVADKALAAGIEERLRVLGFRPRPEGLPMVDNDGAIRAWQVFALLFLITFRLVLAGFVLVDRLELKPRDLVDGDGENPTRIVLRRR